MSSEKPGSSGPERTERGAPIEGGGVRVGPRLTVPRDELEFRFSRSGGPGGQNVNKVETRVELLFDVEGSRALDEAQRERLRAGLSGRIDSRGVLHVASERHRSRKRNIDDVVERFAELLRQALAPRKKRRPTRPTRASKERRLGAKRKRAEIKSSRRSPRSDRD